MSVSHSKAPLAHNAWSEDIQMGEASTQASSSSTENHTSFPSNASNGSPTAALVSDLSSLGLPNLYDWDAQSPYEQTGPSEQPEVDEDCIVELTIEPEPEDLAMVGPVPHPHMFMDNVPDPYSGFFDSGGPQPHFNSEILTELLNTVGSIQGFQSGTHTPIVDAPPSVDEFEATIDEDEDDMVDDEDWDSNGEDGFPTLASGNAFFGTINGLAPTQAHIPITYAQALSPTSFGGLSLANGGLQPTFFSAEDPFIDYVNEDGYLYTDWERNLDFATFLERWAIFQKDLSKRLPRISEEAKRVRSWNRPQEIYAEDLRGDEYDIQGINWKSLGTAKGTARGVRLRAYTNYRSEKALFLLNNPGKTLKDGEKIFRFRKTHNLRRAARSHFQLRNLVYAASKNDVYYAAHSRVLKANPTFGSVSTIMELPRHNPELERMSEFQITTLDSTPEVMVVGSFTGGYAMCRLDDEVDTPHHEGIVTADKEGITNHVAMCASRTNGSPCAVFSSNDRIVRTLDTTTAQFISWHHFQWPINCTAMSPDSRLRVVVGDNKQVLIVNADSGEILQTLLGHQDDGFACAWSSDGRTVATGNQDKQIRIYDARNWKQPLTILAAEQAGVRSLRFSPLGSGRRTLLMAEPADIIHLVDAVMFETEQKEEFFGEIGGTSFTPRGDEFFVANSDRHFGGLMEYEQWGYGGNDVVPRSKESGLYDTCPIEDDLCEGTLRHEVNRGWDWDWDWDPEPRFGIGRRFKRARS